MAGVNFHKLPEKLFANVDDETAKDRKILVFDLMFITLSTGGSVVTIIIIGDIASVMWGFIAEYARSTFFYHKKLS